MRQYSLSVAAICEALLASPSKAFTARLNGKTAKKIAILCSLLMGYPAISYATEDKIALEVTQIKANQELPQILYVVPWKDITGNRETEQKLVLHDFFGDLYDPILPSQPHEEQMPITTEATE